MLIDDHELFCVGLSEFIKSKPDISFLGYHKSVDAFHSRTPADIPDVLLLDITLGTSNGLDSIPLIRKLNPGIRIAVVTMHRSEFYLLYALRIGVEGYFLKDMSPDEFVRGVMLMGRGMQYFAAEISNLAVHGMFDKKSVIANLTAQELKIVQLIGEGLTSQSIARALSLSRRTVEGHRARILSKLGLKNSFGIVRLLFESKTEKK